MITKELLFYFFFFCAYLSKIHANEYDDDMKKWFKAMRNDHYDECHYTISEESLQELEDDPEADNGEIRAWRTCVFIHRKFIVNAKIDNERILNDAKPFFPELNPMEKQTVMTYMNICKEEAELTDVEIDVIGRYTNCAMDRVKSIT